jgi:hypothetical protein
MGAIPLGIYFQGLRKAAIYWHLIKKNMTPEEKAKELFNKFSRHIMHFDELEGWKEYIDSSEAKQFALVTVDEILNINSVDKDFSLSHYWLDVKHEIENL